MRASTWCNLNFMANKYTLTVCEHRRLMFLYVFRYNEKWTLILLVCRWRHSGHLGRQEQKHFSSLGSNLYFHVNSSRRQFYCTDPQHGRLVTWLQTKNTHMVTWYQWRRRGCHQYPSGDCSRNPLFYKNGPWVHITVKHATRTANFCPLSLSNLFLRTCMTRQHISGKKRRENCFYLKVWLCLVICIARHTEKQEHVDLANWLFGES